MKTLLMFLLLVVAAKAQATPVTNINAFYRDGQVFITWDNLTTTSIAYMLYRSLNPIVSGGQLSSAQKLGAVRDNSARNERLSSILGATKYLTIDSAGTPLASTRGLFVATTTTNGSFYYAVTTIAGGVEDTTIELGSNSFLSPIAETIAMPRPIWQESRIISGRTFEIYVQFATKVTSSIYPQMTNVGSYPFHFAIVKSGTVAPHPLTLWMHPDGGSFLSTTSNPVVGEPNEWLVTIDDWIPDASGATTCYYGFHENYDIYSSANPVPTSGILYDYTFARVNHTISWAFRNLPLDSTRTYITAYSAGAAGALLTALAIPSRIAAISVFAPQCDMASTVYFLDNQRWGTPQTNLLTNDGYRRNTRLNANFLARINRSNSLPIVFTYCGKNDVAVGWAEKIPFYDTLSFHRHGGFHFWSMTNHGQVFNNSPWQPTFPNFSFFTRYRTNLSYPAFSSCSINDNPGNGTPSNGDPIGSINGHLDWNDNIVDVGNQWSVTLRLKDLSMTSGSDVAPDSAITDVTLRRLQSFSVPSGYRVNWVNRRNNIAVQQASFVYDGGLITIPGVKVYKDSSRLTVTYTPVSVAEQKTALRDYILSQNYPNPFNPSTTINYQLPAVSHVVLKVFDPLGREVATLVNEQKSPGTYAVQFDAANVASGVYLYRLQAGEFVEMKKCLVLR